MTDAKRGLDDYVANGGSVAEIIAACRPAEDMLEEWSRNESARPRYDFTQWGAAQRLDEALQGRFLWCPKVKWHGWNECEGVWQRPAEYLLLRESVLALKEKTEQECKALADLGSDKAVAMARKYALDMQNVGNVKGAMKFLEPLMVGSWEQFDQDPNKLTVANGTLVFDGDDVRLEDHDPHDYITKKSPVVYDSEASAPFWEQTLQMFVPNDHIRGFLQRLAGSLLVAVGVKEQRIPFFYGNGGCGKSTFAQGMSTILGDDLAVPVDPATIRTAQRSGSSASPDLFSLLGARIVVAEEAEDPDGGKSQGIDVGMIKRWSGGTDSTKIVARPMYGDVVKFMPTFTLVLIANNAPNFKDQTDGIWRRLLVVPFNTPVPAGTRPMESTEVASRFRAEASGMLNWAIEGYRQWRKHGLNPPQEVLLAGQELRRDQDYLGNFLAETTHPEDGGFVSSEAVHEAWTAWRGGDREIPDLSKRKLGEELKKRKGWGETKTKKVDGKTVRGWHGQALGGTEPVTDLPPVTELGDENCDRKTAGQRPKTPPVTEVTELSVRVNHESEKDAEKLERFAGKNCDCVTEGQKHALTCTDAVTELSREKCDRPRVSGLARTFSFTGDDSWRRLYRRGEA